MNLGSLDRVDYDFRFSFGVIIPELGRELKDNFCMLLQYTMLLLSGARSFSGYRLDVSACFSARKHRLELRKLYRAPIADANDERMSL